MKHKNYDKALLAASTKYAECVAEAQDRARRIAGNASQAVTETNPDALDQRLAAIESDARQAREALAEAKRAARDVESLKTGTMSVFAE